MDTRIYCITHKQFTPPDMDGYIPLQVGRALSSDLGYTADDTGDNISFKNKSYCELTGIYWIWKNIKCDIVGICHYRRYFVRDEDFLTKDYIENTLKNYDIIVSDSGTTKKHSVREHYSDIHFESDLDICREAIEYMCPEYLDAFDLCMNCNLMTLGNMIITRKDIFDRYCEWLFALLEEVERRTDITAYDDFQKRLYGYLAERLLRVWLLSNEYRIKEETVRLIDPENIHNEDRIIQLQKRYSELLLDELITQYEQGRPVDICRIDAQTVDFNGKIPAFACWWQGLDDIPDMVMNCLNSIDRNLPENVELHLITLENVFNYIDLPEWIIDKFNSGKITYTHLSDILRMGLLYRYGGMWIDATYFAADAFDENIFSKDFWTLKAAKSEWKADLVGGRWSGNCIYTKPGNILVRFVLNAFYEYWRTQDELIFYFLIDIFIDIAYRRIPGCREMIDAVEPSNPMCHKLRNIANSKYNEQFGEKLCEDTYLFKLQRREEVRQYSIVGEMTYYGWLVSRLTGEK